jgi:hypothetical protein
MSLRVSNSIEKNITNIPQGAPIAIVAGAAAVTVLPSVAGTRGEWAARYLQNVGTGNLYVAFDGTCSTANFNLILSGAGATDSGGFGPGQQLDCSLNPCAISVYSPTGTSIVLTIHKRNDNAAGMGGIIGQLTQISGQ